MAISNECGRLIANVVIAYNSILLSMLMNRYQAPAREKTLELLKNISPVAWQHIHFLGHYMFRDNRPSRPRGSASRGSASRRNPSMTSAPRLATANSLRA